MWYLEMDMANKAETMSVPEAGKKYFGLSRNGNSDHSHWAVASGAGARNGAIARSGRAHRGGCRLSPRKPRVLPDATHPDMWRVRWPDGRLSDITNLTRAKDAVACFMESEGRRQRRRHRPSEGRLCVKTASWAERPSSRTSDKAAEANQ
jgi:hypothetical protein